MASKPRVIIVESVPVQGIVLIAAVNVVNDQLHVTGSAPVNENVTAIVSVSVMEGKLNDYNYKYMHISYPHNMRLLGATGNVHAVGSVSVRRRITTETTGNWNCQFK